jgi:hypothetical protein
LQLVAGEAANRLDLTPRSKKAAEIAEDNGRDLKERQKLLKTGAEI